MSYKKRDYGVIWLFILILFIIFMVLNGCSTSKEINQFKAPPEIIGVKVDISDHKERENTKIVLYEVMVTPAVNIVQVHFYIRSNEEWKKIEEIDNLDMHGVEAQNFIKVISWIQVDNYTGKMKLIFNVYGTHSHDTQEHIVIL